MRSATSILVLLFLATAASATPTFFNDCAVLTGETATVVIGAETPPLIDGIPLASGDEIAIFTPDGLCAGAATWTGESIAIAVWANDSGTDQVDGFLPGQPLGFKAFSGGTVHGSDAATVSIAYDPAFDDGQFAEDAIYVINELAFGPIVGVEGGSLHAFELRSAFPNPFASLTTLQFSIPIETDVHLDVFDLLGRRVAVIVDESLAPGTYERTFEATAGMASGPYIARLRAGTNQAHVRMTLLR